jgi:hypothetical protein
MMGLILCAAAAIPGGASALPETDRVDFESLRQLIDQNDARSVDAALALLPERFRSSFTLMESSHSLQSATPAEPRAILFGEDASFVVAFNAAHNAGGDSLETYQYDRAAAQFVFRSVRFDPAGQEKPVYSEPNPSRCTRCHGTDPYPIWGNYVQWKGAYGATDDDFGERRDFGDGLARPDCRAVQGDGTLKKPSDPACGAFYADLTQFLDFKKNAPSQERYSRLVWRYNYPTSPYSPSDLWFLKHWFAIEDAFGEYDRWSPANINFAPSTRLGLFVSTYMSEYLARQLSEKGDASFWAAMDELLCHPFDNNDPVWKSVLAELDSRPFPASFLDDGSYQGGFNLLQTALAKRALLLDPSVSSYIAMKPRTDFTKDYTYPEESVSFAGPVGRALAPLRPIFNPDSLQANGGCQEIGKRAHDQGN